MPFEAPSRHENRLVIKTEVSVPWNPAVKNYSIMNRNIGT